VIISHSVTGNTEKEVLPDNFIIMEEKRENKSQAVIEVIDFGPLKITGNIILKDFKRDKEDSPGEVWLCRCGKSANKPYCDESHKK
jgi:CDGSH iron-sulfur domain-containing protein 3